ncbi:UDP-N-acetylglucosamine diphosphorylase/glucosamine-1-phosphate N-acetyltransferase [Metallosphaera yellowstonensis MK1]|uniref:UDP-N-acetylglucosamine diphosphorylase/glucosamine-1-phosphate N-acetyltransferase n=1 Tax=Metallosphaera yellowstonensis MK1 TaxID=671065 RepID=H2C6M5_9CREN|nr:bifunctional sugar-1-phosphate nucleotidylyltransferase/acetyltransferase [Metallosphaera yellowstonensis]EHP69452.1 UDP-N-acetylglucosamine diphosphorylase/glucosamine-1-phosphate N-acetyltransferase [Metallosphaera yellowstonensis MK1]
MRVVLLAAGKGERLEPITHTRPKPFVPILGSSLIERTIRIVKDVINDAKISVVVSKGSDEGGEEYGKFFSRLEGLEIVEQGERRGTGGALSYVKPSSEDVLVIYGDVVVEREALEKLVIHEGNAMLGVWVKDPTKYGSLLVDSEGYLQAILEKSPNPPSSLINGGVYKLSSSIFSYVDGLQVSPRGEYELTDAVMKMAKQEKIKVIEHRGDWVDIGRPWDLLEANVKALNKEKGKIEGEIEDGVRIVGKVIVEEGAKVLSGTRIEGPAYIGRGSTVGPNSYVRPYTVLVENVKVGSFVEVKESVIMENTKIPHLSYIGDSVICEDVNFGAGTLVANLRFDEKEVYMIVKGVRENTGRKKMGTVVGGHVRTGINVSILPGVKIGAYARVYPGAVVNRDVGKGELFKA